MQMAHFTFCTMCKMCGRKEGTHLGSVTGMVFSSHFCTDGVVSFTLAQCYNEAAQL